MEFQCPAAAAGLVLACTTLAYAQEPEPRPLGDGWTDEVLTVFFVEVDAQLVLRDVAEIEAAWLALDEEEREMLRVDCAAAIEVGAEVPSEASASGDVADLSEVPPVDGDVRNKLETEEAAAERATLSGEPLETTGPQRRALLVETVPAESWNTLCQAVTELD